MRDLINNITPDAPCKDCKERYTACHDKCEKYQEYKRVSEEARTRVLKIKNFEANFYAEHRKACTRALKKKKGM